MNNDTIAAISTPLGSAGIGVVRISGPDALNILNKIFIPKKSFRPNSKNDRSQQAIFPRRVYYGHIEAEISKKRIDEALVFYMNAPNSFTREDVVEIQSHSGLVNMERIMEAILDCGARLAAPGEFSQRAFLNGRIDLTQAESIIDLINAPCEAAAEIAAAQMGGALRNITREIKTALVSLRSICEADIEFGETDAVDAEPRLSFIRKALDNDLLPRIQQLIQRHKEMAIYKTGILLTIAGAPNVGKSSLMNQLLDNEVSIVSEFPGTTRDVLKAHLSINGIPILACDTAGIHDSNDPVEKIGISRAITTVRMSDIVLLVVDAKTGLRPFERDFLQTYSQKNMVVVVNKIDCCNEEGLLSIEKQLPPEYPSARTMAITGEGLNALKKLIVRQLAIRRPSPDALPTGTPNLRQKKIFERIETETKNCVKMCDAESPLDLISSAIGDIIRLLGDISGRSENNELYEEIFNQFCVGK